MRAGRASAADVGRATPRGAGVWVTWYSICIISLLSVFSSIDRSAITMMVTPIKQDLRLSDTQISLVIGLAYSSLYVLSGLPMARLADNWSRKRMLTLALSGWSVATALCAFAQNFLHLFAFRAIVGMGTSVKGPASVSWIASLAPPGRLPRAYAIMNLAVYGGLALALVVTGALLGVLADLPDLRLPGLGVLRDWQTAFLLIGLPGLLFAVVLHITVPEASRSTSPEAKRIPIRDIARHLRARIRVYAPLSLMAAMYAIDDGGLTVWRPVFFERTFGWEPEVVGPLLGTSLLISTIAGLFIGTVLVEWLAKRYDDANLRAALITQSVGLPFLVFSALAPTGTLALVLMCLGMTCTIAGGPGVLAALQLITPDGMRSQVAGLYMLMLSLVAGALGPFVIAFLTDTIFQSEQMLRYSMATTAAIVTPAGLLFNWLSLRSYRELQSTRPASVQTGAPD